MCRMVLIVGIAALVALADSTAAQEAAAPDESVNPDGMVNAAALRPVPAEGSVSVRPWDDSPENVKLAQEIEDQLRRRGYSVTKNPQLVLSFSVSDQPGHWALGSRRQMIELHGTQGAGEEDRMRAQLNLYSSEKGGVFNEGRPDTTERSVYTLEMTIDRSDGQRLWQGEASAPLGRTERGQLVKLMIAPLLDAVGKTVRNQPFGVK